MATATAAISHEAVLTGSTVDTVTLTRDGLTLTTENISGEVTVLNLDGAARISFTVDGTTPTADGDDCIQIPAAVVAVTVHAPLAANGSLTVKLISAGTPRYAIEVLS